MLEYRNKKKNKIGNKDNFGSVIKLLLHTETKGLALGLLKITKQSKWCMGTKGSVDNYSCKCESQYECRDPLLVIDRKEFRVIAALIKPVGSHS